MKALSHNVQKTQAKGKKGVYTRNMSNFLSKTDFYLGNHFEME